MSFSQRPRRVPLLTLFLLALAVGEPSHADNPPATSKKPTFALPSAAGQDPSAAPVAGQAAPPAATAAKPAEKEAERVPVKLDIKHSGRPLGKELSVSSRYYLWSDPDGWHIRSACKHGYFAGFQGEITATNGTFEKIRPIALEVKGTHADSWSLNPERNKLTFVMHTGDKPDGFDFTIKGKDATVTFDLKIGQRANARQIYIGRDNLHPPKAFFEFPAAH